MPQKPIDYSDIKEFIRQQETHPKPLTPQQLRAILDLKRAIRSGELDLGGKDWVSLLLRYRDAHQKSGCSVSFIDLSAPDNTWACRCQIQLSQDSKTLAFPVAYGPEVQGFSRKKDAKQLMAEGYLPSDGENVVFPKTKPNLAIKQPVPPPQCPTAKEATQPEIQAPEQSQSPPSTESDNGAPLASTSSSASNSNSNTAVSSPQVTTTPARKTSPGQDDKDIPATQRVVKLCSLLDIQTPRYHLTPSQPPTDSTDDDLPSGWYFDGWVDFGQDSGVKIPREVIEAASVKQVYGKKQAKERMAEKLLMWLMEEQRSRDQELGALLSGTLAGKEGAS
ncbi:uncharacterized protein CTHT_0025460 [Thermochaetoides thermophila DSM 1495]|uniref:Uncharacterized protein n=1 Tax=Chaetomium thermophilum (strain DSM 1495 / CBS 144.50 / IMI 039719) TaxID=759272 RepID=G0S5Z4_CHATD|nr:hypothetical protein CTHT_0025460 [Thermochaetoides thermophila DSM 1495]EGS20710.1 hypothetical protein CTHT_0025460 [Thermochaetoides thermophila DSM 1495]